MQTVANMLEMLETSTSTSGHDGPTWSLRKVHGANKQRTVSYSVTGDFIPIK